MSSVGFVLNHITMKTSYTQKLLTLNYITGLCSLNKVGTHWLLNAKKVQQVALKQTLDKTMSVLFHLKLKQTSHPSQLSINSNW